MPALRVPLAPTPLAVPVLDPKFQRQFCGHYIHVQEVSPLNYCLLGYVYECKGDTGKTCVYGKRDSCRDCGDLQC